MTSLEVWHYAVWKGGLQMEPVHMLDFKLFANYPEVQHGMTIIRGNVNCFECKRMMGMPPETWEQWATRLRYPMLQP